MKRSPIYRTTRNPPNESTPPIQEKMKRIHYLNWSAYFKQNLFLRGNPVQTYLDKMAQKIPPLWTGMHFFQ